MFLLKKLTRVSVLSSNDDKAMQSIDLIETYVYGTSKDLVIEKEEIKCSSIIKHTKIITFDDFTKESIKEHNPNWPQIPDHSCKTLKNYRTNSLFDLISQQTDIDKIYLHASRFFYEQPSCSGSSVKNGLKVKQLAKQPLTLKMLLQKMFFEL